MNILFCYAGKPHPKAESAVRAYAPEAIITNTSASDFRYWEVIGKFWNGQEDLVTIEQDIEINPGTIESFSGCPELWCSYSYRAMRGLILDSSLGCSKFSAALQREVTFREMAEYTVTQMPGFKVPSSPALSWKYCDYRIFSHLKFRGHKPHVHGMVNHYHPYPASAVNTVVQESIECYLHNPGNLSLKNVQDALDYAKKGELNVNIVSHSSEL